MSHIEQQPGEHEGQPIEGAARNHRSPVAQAIHRMKARVKEHAARMSRLLGVGGGIMSTAPRRGTQPTPCMGAR